MNEMACYTIPLIFWAAHYGARKKVRGWSEDPRQTRLGYMLAGGATFGIVDHLWNGELFALGDNWMMDIALGFAITGVIFALWGLTVLAEKLLPSKSTASA